MKIYSSRQTTGLPYLSELPESPRDGYQSLHQVLNVLCEATFRHIMSAADTAEDLVDGRVGWQGAVDDDELPLQTLGNIVPSSSRLDHGGQELWTVRKLLYII